MQLNVMKFTPQGQSAPEIAGLDLNGQPMTLSEYRGRVVLISFWATWCAPCMKLIPHERELIDQFQDQQFVIVGVNADDDAEAVAQAVAKHGITWRSFRDARPGAKKISDEWSALFPTLCLIDHKGIIRQRFHGVPPHDVLQEMVADLVEAAKDE
jgi:thiol-disulfide isomerase/thioredoxin